MLPWLGDDPAIDIGLARNGFEPAEGAALRRVDAIAARPYVDALAETDAFRDATRISDANAP